MPRIRITRDRRGRPDEYQSDYARMALAHCRLGATRDALADLFDVNTTTIDRWISRYKEFGDAVKSGIMEAFSPRVVRSLAELAIGYVVDTEEVKVMRTGEIIRYPVRKKYPPNVTACIFWLKNRDPENWRDVQDHILKHQNLDKLTSKELLDEIRKEAAELGILPPTPRRSPRPNADGGDTRH